VPRKTGPAPSTVKRLALLSGNRCAFPRCTIALVDATTGKVVARVCHIKALSPGGPRYDPSQTDKERNSFENLALMCAIHGDVIDADVESYTVERLHKIKADHEVRAGSMPDDLAERVATALGGAVIGGSVIVSQGQTGGQVADSIINIGTFARRITPAVASDIANAIRPFAGEHVSIEAVMGDADSVELGDQLNEVLTSAGWTVDGVSQVIWMPNPKGVILIGTEQHMRTATPLGEALVRAGIRTAGALDPKAAKITIRIGPDLRGAG
jgi:hypothetical protein